MEEGAELLSMLLSDEAGYDPSAKQFPPKPVIAVRELVVFPNVVTAISLASQAAVAAPREAWAGDRRVIVILTTDHNGGEPSVKDLAATGTFA